MKHSPNPDILENLRSPDRSNLAPSPEVRGRVMCAIEAEDHRPAFGWNWTTWTGLGITALAASLAIAAVFGLSEGKPDLLPALPSSPALRVVLPAFDVAALPVEIEQRVNRVYATEWAHIKGDLAALEGYLVARLPSGM